METLRRVASETFVIGWRDALLVFASGLGLGVLLTLVATSFIA